MFQGAGGGVKGIFKKEKSDQGCEHSFFLVGKELNCEWGGGDTYNPQGQDRPTAL